ncbi:MAG TPA: AraC family transcriptional regulator [Prolixibacteraceae bacterium]|nr:AraC family transcriptional regulator [Prolixibacteraceae bacterium]HPS12753.1 AraC family transcriptional regulator [Prolixibacteraceae bacterium]
MKPFYQKLVTQPENSVLLIDEEIPHFTVPWHFHPEIEILLVIKSIGTVYVGDGISRFTEGEISIIGENIPHWWKSDPIYLEKKSSLNTKALIIQFNKDIFGTSFMNLPEMAAIKNLLERSQRGIQFLGKTREDIGKQVRRMFKQDGILRVTELILLLNLMANSTEYRYHSSVGYSQLANSYDFYRFNKVQEYIIRNFNQTIKLEEVAKTVSMSPTAFCRYFKKHTGKTFLEFVTEFKIGQACKFLSEEKMSVSRACYESGFNNLSHFNEQFKKIVHLTPTEYKAAYSD